MIEAVPRFGCVLLPYPPQPPIASPRATIASTALAVSSEARAFRSFPLRAITRQNKAKATRSAGGGGDRQRGAGVPVGGSNRSRVEGAGDAGNRRARKRDVVRETTGRCDGQHELSGLAGGHGCGRGSCSQRKISGRRGDVHRRRSAAGQESYISAVQR